MSDEQLILSRMSAGPKDATGQTIGFQLEGEDGRKVDVVCPHDLVESVIRFMVELARDASDRRETMTRDSFNRAETAEIDPLPISHVTFMADPETVEIVLLLRMFGFDLGFSVTPEHLLSLKKELERILPALGIMDRKPDHDHHHDHHHHHDH